MLELELMHNYSTSTANSLVTTYVTREIFRISIPKLALSHSFLMRSLLAISALHIAYYTPSRREQLTSYAMEQHQASSRAAFSMMMDLTEDSYIPIYIFSVLTYVFAMALPPVRVHVFPITSTRKTISRSVYFVPIPKELHSNLPYISSLVYS